jgi:hypothetical protein
VRLTTVVAAVPESIGFLPFAAGSGPSAAISALGLGGRQFDLDIEGFRLVVDEQADDAWLHELFSPALCEWLTRSPEGFSFELSDGVLCVSRDGHLTAESDLTSLCEDAGHLAAAIRAESLEEVDSGSVERSAAKEKPDPEELLVQRMLPLVSFSKPPANTVDALPVFRELVVRHPATWFVASFMALAWTLGINVIGGGIFGLLLNLPNPGLSVLIFEIVVLSISLYFSFRHQINSRSQRLAAEAFWHEYTKARELTQLEPRSFAASHARAGLPAAPQRVLSGSFGGRPGALMICGSGMRRGDTIALVAGPAGPVASLPFEVSAPGPSVETLDSHTARLVEALSQAPARP